MLFSRSHAQQVSTIVIVARRELPRSNPNLPSAIEQKQACSCSSDVDNNYVVVSAFDEHFHLKKIAAPMLKGKTSLAGL